MGNLFNALTYLAWLSVFVAYTALALVFQNPFWPEAVLSAHEFLAKGVFVASGLTLMAAFFCSPIVIAFALFFNSKTPKILATACLLVLLVRFGIQP